MVDYAKIVAHLIEGMKEQEKRITQLEQYINTWK